MVWCWYEARVSLNGCLNADKDRVKVVPAIALVESSFLDVDLVSISKNSAQLPLEIAVNGR